MLNHKRITSVSLLLFSHAHQWHLQKKLQNYLRWLDTYYYPVRWPDGCSLSTCFALMNMLLFTGTYCCYCITAEGDHTVLNDKTNTAVFKNVHPYLLKSVHCYLPIITTPATLLYALLSIPGSIRN